MPIGLQKEIHFRELKETSVQVWPIIEAQMLQVDPLIFRGIKVDMERYMAIRRNKLLLRPFLARMCIELNPKLNWNSFLPFLGAVEMLNISSYQSNFCFDEKGHLSTKRDRDNQFICSMISFSKSLELLGDMGSAFNSDQVAFILHRFSESNSQIYEGQYCDLNILSIDEICNFPDIEGFLEAYINRCRLIGGSTFNVCSSVSTCDFESNIACCLQEYLISLGIAAQMINDLADFIPHKSRIYAAPLADLTMGRLTLPVYYLYQHGYPIIEWRDRLISGGGGANEEKYCNLILDALFEINIEKHIRLLIRSRIFPEIKKSLRILSRHCSNDAVERFAFAFHFIYGSRLLSFFRK